MRFIEARYEEGLLKPETPGERGALIVVRHPDPSRWDLERLAKSGAGEDRVLAERGLAEWADALDLTRNAAAAKASSQSKYVG